MQLRLNRAHPLCLPSRNLVFATFGTGMGGQVLDLSDSPQHGVMSHASTRQTIHRSLQSEKIPGLPSDIPGLTFREALNAAVSFGNPTKVTALTGGLTVAMWVRPWSVSADSIALSTTVSNNGGWAFCPSLTASGTPQSIGLISWNGFSTSYVSSNAVLPIRQWSLIAFNLSAASVQFFVNGAARGGGGIDQDPTSGSNLTLGSYGSTRPNADIGPTFIWGSMLSADDVALLYKNTWGMVTLTTSPRLTGIPAPVVTNNSASGSSGSSGMIQMSATNSPTSWSLISPPAGVTIDASGLVTWSSSTAVAVHTITVRATNATGSGDGTLTLTIVGPPTVLNPTNIGGTLGSLFTTYISGTDNPTSYSGFGLPRWLSVDTSNGLIIGTIPFGAVKTFSSILYATNANGAGSKNITFNFVKPSANSGFITKAKASEPYKQGSRVTSLGLGFTKTSGLQSADNPNMTNRLDHGKYYGR